MGTVETTQGNIEARFRDLGKRVDRMIERVRGFTDQEVEPAVRSEVEVWKALVDDFRLQMRLGKMEAIERVEPIIDRLQEALDEVRRRLDGIFESDEMEELDEALVDTFKSLREEIKRAEELR